MINEDFILRMKDLSSKTYDTIESSIYKGIIDNTKEIINGMTLEEFAKACFTSKPTILKFCKNIGLSGYSELRYKIRSSDSSKDAIFTELNISKDYNNESFKSKYIEIVKKYADYSSDWFDNNQEEVDKIINQINEGGIIYIYASNLAYSSSRNFFQKMIWGSKFVVLENDITLFESFINQSKENDIFIMISLSGKNPQTKQLINAINGKRKVFGILGPHNISQDKLWTQILVPQWENKLWDNYSVRGQLLINLFDILHFEIFNKI
ncbi:MurR/RpiR family transcriptional regulator [Mesoplasma photuris]|uniref:MurR/RpiR family transcriptional regulator n=1 Tax=Mesoplasma photuris TaxID=217731 RepID=UPI0004E289B3|nr:MurR/RpiR family transcriptional regulator [Mesoplasma photuris]